MTEWTLQKSVHAEDAEFPWTVTDPDGGFTDFDSWQDALDYMEEEIRRHENGNQTLPR